MTCALCDPGLAPILADGSHWRLVLNHNQNLLGKSFLVIRRHVESVPELTTAEWQQLHRQMAGATTALAMAFAPDHFNYAFLQNQDRHVHLHIIPRYAGVRVFEGLEFVDRGYPGHYEVDDVRRVGAEVQARIDERIRSLLPNA